MLVMKILIEYTNPSGNKRLVAGSLVPNQELSLYLR